LYHLKLNLHFCQFESSRSFGIHGVVAKKLYKQKWYCSEHFRRVAGSNAREDVVDELRHDGNPSTVDQTGKERTDQAKEKTDQAEYVRKLIEQQQKWLHEQQEKQQQQWLQAQREQQEKQQEQWLRMSEFMQSLKQQQQSSLPPSSSLPPPVVSSPPFVPQSSWPVTAFNPRQDVQSQARQAQQEGARQTQQEGARQTRYVNSIDEDEEREDVDMSEVDPHNGITTKDIEMADNLKNDQFD